MVHLPMKFGRFHRGGTDRTSHAAPSAELKLRSTWRLIDSKNLDFDEAWLKIRQACDVVIINPEDGLIQDEWVKTYTLIYKLCTNSSKPKPEAVYWRFVSYIRDHTSQILNKLRDLSSNALLGAYVRCFDSFNESSIFLTELFAYLERSWIAQQKELQAQGLSDANMLESDPDSDRHLSERNVHDIRTTMMVQWFFNVYEQLQEPLLTVAMSLVERVRISQMSLAESGESSCGDVTSVLARFVSTFPILGCVYQASEEDYSHYPECVSVELKKRIRERKTNDVLKAAMDENGQDHPGRPQWEQHALASVTLQPGGPPRGGQQPPTGLRRRSWGSLASRMSSHSDAGNDSPDELLLYEWSGREGAEPLALYREAFECRFLQETLDFYSSVGVNAIAEGTVTEYGAKVYRIINQACRLGRAFLHPSTMPCLRRTCEWALIQRHLKELQDECCLLFDKDPSALRGFFVLLQRIEGGLTPVLAQCQALVERHGLQAIARAECEIQAAKASTSPRTPVLKPPAATIVTLADEPHASQKPGESNTARTNETGTPQQLTARSGRNSLSASELPATSSLTNAGLEQTPGPDAGSRPTSQGETSGSAAVPAELLGKDSATATTTPAGAAAVPELGRPGSRASGLSSDGAAAHEVAPGGAGTAREATPLSYHTARPSSTGSAATNVGAQVSPFRQLTGQNESYHRRLHWAVSFVDAAMEVHSRFSLLVDESFSGSLEFVSAVDQGCRRFINSFERAPELLAVYVNEILERGVTPAGQRLGRQKQFGKAVVECSDDVDEALDRAETLFKYVESKDVFLLYYTRFLAQRLLMDTSYSDEAEGSMVSRLRRICGAHSVSSLQKMLSDITLSADLSASFARPSHTPITVSHPPPPATHKQRSPDFSVAVLAKGCWPLEGYTGNFIIPASLAPDVHDFTDFYQGRYHGRVLHWVFPASRCELRVLFLARKYEIQMSLFQAAILLQFNTSDSQEITVADLLLATGLSEVDLAVALRPLVRVKLLFIVSPVLSCSYPPKLPTPASDTGNSQPVDLICDAVPSASASLSESLRSTRASPDTRASVSASGSNLRTCSLPAESAASHSSTMNSSVCGDKKKRPMSGGGSRPRLRSSGIAPSPGPDPPLTLSGDPASDDPAAPLISPTQFSPHTPAGRVLPLGSRVAPGPSPSAEDEPRSGDSARRTAFQTPAAQLPASSSEGGSSSRDPSGRPPRSRSLVKSSNAPEEGPPRSSRRNSSTVQPIRASRSSESRSPRVRRRSAVSSSSPSPTRTSPSPSRPQSPSLNSPRRQASPSSPSQSPTEARPESPAQVLLSSPMAPGCLPPGVTGVAALPNQGNASSNDGRTSSRGVTGDVLRTASAGSCSSRLGSAASGEGELGPVETVLGGNDHTDDPESEVSARSLSGGRGSFSSASASSRGRSRPSSRNDDAPGQSASSPLMTMGCAHRDGRGADNAAELDTEWPPPSFATPTNCDVADESMDLFSPRSSPPFDTPEETSSPTASVHQDDPLSSSISPTRKSPVMVPPLMVPHTGHILGVEGSRSANTVSSVYAVNPKEMAVVGYPAGDPLAQLGGSSLPGSVLPSHPTASDFQEKPPNVAALTKVENSMPPSLRSNHMVMLNYEFSFRRSKLRLPAQSLFAPPSGSRQGSANEVEANVGEDRKIHLQAAIVRIMKARITLSHNELISEVINKVSERFVPTIQDIKRNIDMLIEKDFIERLAVDSYQYVA